MRAELSTRLAGKRVLVLGVGNRIRGDDAAGPLLVERLRGKVDAPLIDAEDVPENYLMPIEESDADLVLVIDATDLGANAGDVAIFDIGHARGDTVSTHAAHIGLLFKAIAPEARPQVIVLGIQPGTTELGKGLSEEVSTTLENLEMILVDCLK